MAGRLLCLVLLVGPAFAIVPDYISVCGRRNPELNKCVLESVSKMTPLLQKGIPELDVPSLEPLHIDEIALANLDDFRAVATDVKLRGLSNYVVRYLKVDLDAQRFDIDLLFPKVYLNSAYDVKAKIIVPISEQGPIHIVTDDIEATATLKFKVIERNGVRRIYFPTMTCKVHVKDYQAEYNAEAKNAITHAINSILATSRQELIDSMTPSLETAISKKVLEVANQICKHFTYEELFPDRP